MRRLVTLACLLLVAAMPTTEPSARTTGPTEPIGAPPDDLRQGFYTKCAYFRGMAILGNAKVDDRAFHKLVDVFGKELAHCDPRVMPTLVAGGTHYSIIAESDGQTLLPELADERNDATVDWDKRARGMGGRCASGGEENILELPSDRYKGECIYLHEFAHTLDRYAFSVIDPGFRRSLRAAYTHAKGAGLWQNTYGITNQAEYFAEGVQMYFDCARGGNPADGVHNEVINRDQLSSYDPDLFAVIDKAFGHNPWRYEGKYNTTGKVLSYGMRPRRPTTREDHP
jgi:alpha-glucosidase